MKPIICVQMRKYNFPISATHISIAKFGWLRVAQARNDDLHRAQSLSQSSILWSEVLRLSLSPASGCRTNKMKSPPKPTLACLTVLVIAMFGVQGACAQDNRDRAAPQHFAADGGGRSLRIDGDAAALHVEVQRATIADVLSALESFNIRYRSSIGLDEVLDGTYAGSLGHVVARLLNGYNYAAKQDGPRLEVTIFGKHGEFSVPAPIVIPVRRRPSD
jgi:hypothetical protein